jgi:hypothetical protein
MLLITSFLRSRQILRRRAHPVIETHPNRPIIRLRVHARESCYWVYGWLDGLVVGRTDGWWMIWRVRYRARAQQWIACCLVQSQTPQELFNLHHAQVRNAIECIFGIAKKCHKILAITPEYLIPTISIVTASHPPQLQKIIIVQVMVPATNIAVEVAMRIQPVAEVP